MQKTIRLDGKFEASMHASIEEIIMTMRTLHGPEVKLAGIQESRMGDKTLLNLVFERPAILFSASLYSLLHYSNESSFKKA